MRDNCEPAVKLQDGAVDLVAELDHGFGLVEVFPGKKRRCDSTEGALRGDEDLAGVLAAASDVEQAKQHTGRAAAVRFFKKRRAGDVSTRLSLVFTGMVRIVVQTCYIGSLVEVD